jgi:putative two-component system response regulator
MSMNKLIENDKTTTKAKILIADDETIVRMLISRSLTEKGHDCTAVSDGFQILEKLASGYYDLILLDINMPGKSGVETLDEIMLKYPDAAVIMITAVSDIDTAIELMRKGAYDYIVKPLDLDMLSMRIEKAMDKRRLLLDNRNYQHRLEDTLSLQTDKVRKTFYNSITSLVYALEAKDKYTSGHSQRVADIAVQIARELGVSDEKLEKIKFAGLVHDIGKIGVRESILNKPGPLTDEEYRHVMNHCELGERILSPIVEDKDILEMVKYHHERYDGNGYPNKLHAEDIPEGAKILAVADAFLNIIEGRKRNKEINNGYQILAVADSYDAMTSDRPYRKAMSTEKACVELKRGKGKQFDPVVVDALFSLIENGKLE